MYAVTRLVLPGGAYDALQQTHQPILAELVVESRPMPRGSQVILRGTPEAIVTVKTLLRQIESGAWPGMSAYGRLACRRALRLC